MFRCTYFSVMNPVASKHIMNCFQHTLYLIRLHTHTHSPKHLAHPRSPMPPLSTLTARATHARPLLPAALASVPYEFVISSSSSYGAVMARISAVFRGLGPKHGSGPFATGPGLLSHHLKVLLECMHVSGSYEESPAAYDMTSIKTTQEDREEGARQHQGSL